MNRYTLDYSDPRPDERPPNRRAGQSFRQSVLLVGALICGTAFVAAIRMHADARFHRVNYQTQTIRYDSLLTAKAEADSQLRHLRTVLANTPPKTLK